MPDFPKFNDFLSPFLEIVKDKKVWPLKSIRSELISRFEFSEEDLRLTIPSGGSLFNNRSGWARTFLKKAGFIESPQRAHFRITDIGSEMLSKGLTQITVEDLKTYGGGPEFEGFFTLKTQKGHRTESVTASPTESPIEIIGNAYLEMKTLVEQELLERLKKVDPYEFENIVLSVMKSIGYGEKVKDPGSTTSKGADEGIDGIIKEDALGLDRIYFQAKRYKEGSVSRPQVQSFAGALQGKKAKKGVFITTSKFTKEALTYVESLDTTIILIDGRQLAELMYDYDVGFSTVSTYRIKNVDEDYFENL